MCRIQNDAFYVMYWSCTKKTREEASLVMLWSQKKMARDEKKIGRALDVYLHDQEHDHDFGCGDHSVVRYDKIGLK